MHMLRPPLSDPTTRQARGTRHVPPNRPFGEPADTPMHREETEARRGKATRPT